MTREKLTSVMAAMFVTLATKFPCCGAKCRIRATNDVPREVYDRTCKRCGITWEVERKTLRQGKEKRIDSLVWTLMRMKKTEGAKFSRDGIYLGVTP